MIDSFHLPLEIYSLSFSICYVLWEAGMYGLPCPLDSCWIQQKGSISALKGGQRVKPNLPHLLLARSPWIVSISQQRPCQEAPTLWFLIISPSLTLSGKGRNRMGKIVRSFWQFLTHGVAPSFVGLTLYAHISVNSPFINLSSIISFESLPISYRNPDLQTFNTETSEI